MQPAEKAPLVIVKGMAGTSKTFYSLAVGLEKVLNDPSGEYRRILICRPNALFDSDIGFLPGNEQEKKRRSFSWEIPIRSTVPIWTTGPMGSAMRRST